MTWTKDLARVHHRHVPELAYTSGLESSLEVVAVGWLGDRVPSTGAVDEDLRTALEHFSRYHYLDGGELGLHTCEICGRFASRGEMLIETPGGRYMLPQLVLHYIADHDYRPPEVFLRDLSRHWASPEASPCRTRSCGDAPRRPCLEPVPEEEDTRRDAEKEELVRFATKLREEGLGAAEIKARLLQWARARVAKLEETVDLDALSPAEDMCRDIDPMPSGRSKTIVDNREVQNQGVSRAGHVVSVIFRILNLSFPIVVLTGVVWLLYWLLS